MPYRIPSTILFSESFPEWDHWGEVFHSNKTKCVSTLGIRQALASLYIMREGRRRRKRSESVPRGSFEFHALGFQAFRRGSGICQRPLTEDSSQLDKIHGPNFFFFLLSLFFGFLLGSKISAPYYLITRNQWSRTWILRSRSLEQS